jgi:hypothetical protein
MLSRVLIVGLLITLAGPLDAVWAAEGSTTGSTSGSTSRWGRFSSTSVRTPSPIDDGTLAATDPPAVATIEVLSDDYVSESESTRLFRCGASPPHYGGHHSEPPPNYNFRDPDYYPDAGLGFPILSAHGTWIGGRTGVREWKHRGYHENYHQGTIQWRW